MNDVWSKPIPEPESPCVKVCSINSQTGYCLGCFRSLTEIRDWVTASNVDKELILMKIKERKYNEISSV